MYDNVYYMYKTIVEYSSGICYRPDNTDHLKLDGSPWAWQDIDSLSHKHFIMTHIMSVVAFKLNRLGIAWKGGVFQFFSRTKVIDRYTSTHHKNISATTVLLYLILLFLNEQGNVVKPWVLKASIYGVLDLFNLCCLYI